MACDTGYTSEQLQKLEELFAQCEYPDRAQREKWSKDLGMDLDLIKNWFKNKILLLKTEGKREENEALRMENAKLRRENMMMRQKLENCPKRCNCSRNEPLEHLLRENAKLKEEHQRVTNIAVGILQNHSLLQFNDEEIQALDIDLELGLAPPSSHTSNNKFDD